MQGIRRHKLGDKLGNKPEEACNQLGDMGDKMGHKMGDCSGGPASRSQARF